MPLSYAAQSASVCITSRRSLGRTISFGGIGPINAGIPRAVSTISHRRPCWGNWDRDGLDDLLGRVYRQRFQCTVHAVGDRAIEQTLNAMARAQREFPRAARRHRIEHCAICPPDLQDRVRAQHIMPAMQPAFF
jgi:Amidohydrolase family